MASGRAFGQVECGGRCRSVGVGQVSGWAPVTSDVRPGGTELLSKLSTPHTSRRWWTSAESKSRGQIPSWVTGRAFHSTPPAVIIIDAFLRRHGDAQRQPQSTRLDTPIACLFKQRANHSIPPVPAQHCTSRRATFHCAAHTTPKLAQHVRRRVHDGGRSRGQPTPKAT